MTNKLSLTVLAAALLVPGAHATPQNRATVLVVQMTPSGVTPRPKHVPMNARATFSMKLPYRATLHFRITYSHLSDANPSAYLALARPGTVVPRSLAICGDPRPACRSSASWSMTNPAFADRMRAAGAVVVITTARNPRGELGARITPAMLRA